MSILTKVNALISFLDGIQQHHHVETIGQLLRSHEAVDLDSLCEEWGQSFVSVTGHDNAVLGVAFSCGGAPRLAYNASVIRDNLIEEGMTDEEAQEFYDFKIVAAYIGEETPVFIEIPK